MLAVTKASPRGLESIVRLFDALTDPARRERAVAVVLSGYVVLWTLYAVLAKGGQDIHVDMSEQYVLSRKLAWGYPKHPPLAMLIVRTWFAVFPTADWAYYLLAMTTAGLTLWIAWRLSARYLDADKRVVGLALLTFIPFFNFHALKFNVNTVLMPLWAAATLAFLRSFESRRVLDAALAGVLAAATMYGKYWSVVLLLGLGVAALADSRRAAYFRSAAPWVTIAVGALALAPHAAWLVANDFAPFSYAVVVHGAAPVASTLRSAAGYLAGSIAYVAVPLIILAVAARPGPAALQDMAWPAEPGRRLAALAFWSVLLLPAVIAPLAGVQLVSLWSMSAWALLPVMLLSSPLVAVSRRDATRILALALIFPLVMVVLAPAIALSIHRFGLASGTLYSSVLVGPVEQLWRATTDRPLRNFAGYDDLTGGVAFYMPSHPFAAHLLDNNDQHIFDDRIARDGIVLVCPARTIDPPAATWCRSSATSLAARFPAGRRAEIEVSRRYLGFDGPPASHLIITIPPSR